MQSDDGILGCIRSGWQQLRPGVLNWKFLVPVHFEPGSLQYCALLLQPVVGPIMLRMDMRLHDFDFLKEQEARRDLR